jgi:hypothetical protein
MSLEDRVKQSSRRGSAVAIVSNPLEVDSAGGLTSPLKLVKLSDSRAVTAPELKTICDRLQSLGDNQAILDSLENEIEPFLFTCADLIKLLHVTTSIKTKLSIVSTVCPRLSDPKAGFEQLTNLFRYAEEKEIVEEAVKSRIQTLTGAAFSRSGMLTTAVSGRGIGRGRGAGRGTGHRPSLEGSSLASTAEYVSSSTASAAAEVTSDEAVNKKPFSS